MSNSPSLPTEPNSPQAAARFEAQLLAVARALPYPPTPDLAARPRLAAAARTTPAKAAPAARLGWTLAAGLMALLGLLAVPAVRAGVIEVLRLGAVRILLGGEATATPAATPLASVLDLYGETTLAEARERLSLPIRLPAYPADLGEPDAVFVQDLEGEAVVLVWVEPDDPSQVRLSLHLLASPMLVDKVIKDQPSGMEFTLVNGREAFWTTGPYFVVARNGFLIETRLISGHVLVWYEREVTYRLETDLPLEEAIKIAESLE